MPLLPKLLAWLGMAIAGIMGFRMFTICGTVADETVGDNDDAGVVEVCCGGQIK